MMFQTRNRIFRAPGVAGAVTVTFALAILPGALSAATPGGPPGGPPPTAAPNAGSSPPPATPINAPPPAVAADDCTPLPVSLPPGTEELTREERLARLDRALNESLARFAKCQGGGGGGTIAQQPGGGEGAPPATAGSGGPPGGAPPTVAGGKESPPGGPPPGSGEGTQEPSNETPIPSVAAHGIRGPGDTASSEGEPTVASAPGNTPPTAGGAPGLPSPSGEGDVPEDIPSGDNDGVLEAQIRRAAMAETDPKRKAELWNEYRRYKGLPTKPVAEAKSPQPTAEARPQ